NEHLLIRIAAPFPHISVHVVQTPRVRRLLPYLVGMILGIGAVPGKIGEPRFVVAEAVQRLRPSAAGKFPLRFGWQAILPARRQPACLPLLLGEHTAELDGVLPRDALDRQLVHIDSVRRGGTGPGRTIRGGAIVHYLAVLALR